ncbi:MAG: HAMP domain-containing sensor histidine kinase [Bacteroidota bacterium]
MDGKFQKDLRAPWVIALAMAGVFTLMGMLLIWAVGISTPFWVGILYFLLISLGIYLYLDKVIYRQIRELQFHAQRELTKLKDMEAYRREFLGEVSHELKTPIFAIQGFIHTLIDGAMDDHRVRKKFLKKAMKNSDRLSNLVEDLLVITQAESGEMEVRVRRFQITELIQDVLDSFEYKFTKKNRNIQYRFQDNSYSETFVLADEERIRQVLTNLIDNAIKYGNQEGTVRISLGSDEEKIYVSIEDDGPGIEEEHLDKIFRRFYRVDKSRSREKGGTGLGLAICKHLMSAHGEKITVNSTVGEGTTFTFSLKKATHVQA